MQTEIDDTQMRCVAEYADAAGLSMDDCLYQALDDWIRSVARTVSQTEKFNVVAMLPARQWN